MRLPEFCLRLGATSALILLCSASPVLLHTVDQPQLPAQDDGGILAQQAGWIHRETLSKTHTVITLPQPNLIPPTSAKARLPFMDGLLRSGDSEEGEGDGEEGEIEILGGDDDEESFVHVMKQPSTPPRSLPSDPYAYYTYQEDLSDDEGFRGGRIKGRRTIIVGDIHGSLVGLDGFLRQIKYNNATDRLIIAGDLVAKGPQSLQVLDRLDALGAKCVRGNHDDKVLRWKGYLNSLTQRQRLELEWDAAQRPPVLDDENSPEYDADIPNVRPRPQKGSIPSDLIENSQHHQIAKMMTDKQYKYLVGCPLILTLPKGLSVRKRTIHVTHAGIDPRRDIQHQEPWVLFNIRNVLKNGTPSRKAKKGKGWAYLYNRLHRARSKFIRSLKSRSLSDDDDNEGDDDDNSSLFGNMRLNHNYMIVYGHDAKRSLNVQDWSIGLDTGCVYGRELSGYVVETGQILQHPCPDVVEDDDEE